MAGLLEVDGLAVDMAGRTILHGLDLRIDPGAVIALVGHNGAGKTTTMRALAGLERAGGKITLAGEDVSRMGAADRARRGIALVPDGGNGVFAGLSVSENLKLGKVGARIGSKDAERASDLIGEIAPFVHDRPKQKAGSLSGGQRQMLALASALGRLPRLLLLDEPSIGLAPSVVSHLMVSIGRVAAQLGMGVLLVEQNLAAALTVAEKVLIMKEGRIAASFRSQDAPPVNELLHHF
jgi:branched-chain amino acid transport system ATP-binding protein